MDEDRLVQARHRLLDAFTRCFSSDPSVIGVFVGGSVAAGIADPWSDIDLRVIVPREKHASYVERRREIPQQVDGFLFNEWLSGTVHCISHFRDFVKVDIFYLDSSSFTPSPWYGLPILILHDPTGLIQEVVDRSKNLRFEYKAEEIERSAGKGVAAIHEAYRRLRRGELVFVQSLLDELRQHMTFADDWLNARPPQAVPFSRLETRISEPMLRIFQSSFGPLESDALEAPLIALAAYYSGQLQEISARTGVPLAGHIQAIALVAPR